MDIKIIIDDDFTLDVVEEEDDEDVESIDNCNNKESRCGVENNTNFVNNIHIKEEFDIDLEDNYLLANTYVNITEIKTEINSESENEGEPQEKISAGEEEIPALPNAVPEKNPDITSNEQNVPDTKIGDVETEEASNITSADVELHEESVPRSQIRQSSAKPRGKEQKAPNPVNKSARAALDRRKICAGLKKNGPPKMLHHHRHNDKSVLPFRFKSQRKLSPPKFRRNRHDSLLPKSVFRKKPQHNFHGARNIWKNASYKGFNDSRNCPFDFHPNQTPSVDWQTYSTILSALNQLLGQNLNSQFNSDNSFPFVGRKRRFWKRRAQFRNRPQVWANECQNKAPPFDNSTQLQMYTTILSAVTQLSNRATMQDCQSTSCMNHVELQMSFFNIFRSF